jgi:putative tryptophan/tyrosine transport system substrate-binding protein
MDGPMAPNIARRRFIAALGSVAAWSFEASAQQPALPVVGFIRDGSADADARYATAFRKGLSETGAIEGQNVIVEYHWLEGQYDRLPALVADLLRRQVAVIATPGVAPTLAVKAATTTIPIVFGVGEDPVRLGLVASLARPGGNATGINFFATEVTAKRLRLLHDLVPKAVRVAVLINPADTSVVETTLREVREAAPAIGLQIQIINANTIGEIDAAFDAFAHQRPDALFVEADAVFTNRRQQLATLTAVNKIPAAFSNRDFVAAGGLMLWNRPGGQFSSNRCLYRQHPQRDQANRHAGAAIDQVRVRYQPANSARAWHRGALRAPLYRRRGNRVTVCPMPTMGH